MSEHECDVPSCDQPSFALVANDAPLMTPEYSERRVCRWHLGNPFGDQGAEVCRHEGGTDDCPATCLLIYGGTFATEALRGDQ